MKNCRKLISIILTLCMVMQILPVFATEGDTQTSVTGGGINYLINDDFAIATAEDDGQDGWSLVRDNGVGTTVAPDTMVSTEEILDAEGNGTGNYALKYAVTTSNFANTHISRPLANPVTFTDDTTVVIETRMKQSSGTGRSYLKYNFAPATGSWEYAFDWGTLVANSKGTVYGVNGWKTSKLKVNDVNTTFYNYSNTIINKSVAADSWYNVKVVIHGTEGGTANTADYIITNDDGTLIGEAYGNTIKFPDNQMWAGLQTDVDNNNYPTNPTWVENALNTIDFRQRDNNTIWVDYVRVYEVYGDVDVSVNAIIKRGEPVNVTFDVPTGHDSFINAVSIENAEGVKVNATNTANAAKNVITVTPDSELANGTYKVKIDTTNIPEECYTITQTSLNFKVADLSYIIYDDFSASSQDNWSLVRDNGISETTAPDTMVSTEEILDAEGNGTGNYALKYAVTTSNYVNTHISRALANPVTFTNDTTVVIETRMKQSSGGGAGGRSYLKYNFAPASDSQEYNFDWGTLVGNSKGSLYGANSWKKSGTITDEDTSETINFYSYAKTTSLGSVDAESWYNVKVIIHGSEGGASNTAEYIVTDDNGTVIGQTTEPVSIDFPDNSTWGTGATAIVAENQNWVEDALNTIDFRQRDNNTIWVDYVRVYEAEKVSVRANLVNGRYFPFDGGIEVKMTAEESLTMVEKTVTLTTEDGEKIETNASYNSETNILTVVPAEPLEAGTVCKLTFTDNDFNTFTGTTEFEVEAGAHRSTGLAIYDNFADGVNEWEVGPSQTGYEAQISQKSAEDDENVEGATDGKALKIEFPAKKSSPLATDTSIYGNVTRAIGNGIEFSDDKTVIVKTRVKKIGASANYILRLNRPNTLEQITNDYTWNHYALFSNNAGEKAGVSAFYALTENSGGHEWILPNFKAINGTTDYELADKWVTYTLEFKPAERKFYTTITYTDANGEEVTVAENNSTGVMWAAKEALENEYGEGYYNDFDKSLKNYPYYTALDRLTFTSTADCDIYIDYIKVCEYSPVEFAVDSKTMLGNADIGAYIKTDEALSDDITSYVDLYNGDAVVEATKTYDEAANKIVIDPINNLEVGEYTVKFKADELDALGYTIEGDSEFAVSVITSTEVSETFEDITTAELTNDGWYSRFNIDGVTSALTVESEGENNYLRLNVSGNIAFVKDKLVTYSKNLSTAPFVRDMKASTVFEMKVRASAPTGTGTVRKLVKYNNPTVPGEPDGNGDYFNAYGEYGWNTRAAALLAANTINISYQDAREAGSQKQGAPEKVSDYQDAQWYTVKTVYHNTEGTASTYVYDKDGTLVGSLEDKPLTAWWFNYSDYNETQPQVMHTIEDITLQFRPVASGGATIAVENEYLDIDDIHIYNITEATEGASVKFMSGENEVKSITEDGNVTPTFTIQSMNNETTDYYVIAAKYEDGKLVSTQMKEVEVTGEQTVTLDAIEVDKDNTGLVVKAFVWNKNMVPVCSATVIKPTVYTIYMSARGSDSNQGYESAPVATLNRAIELANDAKTNGYATAEVIIEDGNYELTGETITIDSNLEADSLTVRARNQGKAKFVNGSVFKISEATLVKNTESATAIFERLEHQSNIDAIKDNLYVINLNTRFPGITIPEMNLMGTYSYYCTAKVSAGSKGITMANGLEYDVDEPNSPTSELFFAEKPMTLARYPDATATNPYAIIGTVEVLGTKTSGAELTLPSSGFQYTARSVTRNWLSENEGKDDYIVQDYRYADPFTVTLDQAKNWGSAEDAYMFGFWAYDWATQAVAVKDINTTTGVITSKYPSHYGLITGQRYYVYNLLEEITAPGEYYIDRESGNLYFYKPEGATEDSEITISLHVGEVFDISASNVTIDGLVIGASRGSAVKATGNNVKIKNCDISGTAETAVSLEGTNGVIENCTIHDVNGGINLAGGNKNTLTTGNNKALSNIITNFSRIDKSYTDAIFIDGVGNKASYNTISDGEHLAIRIAGVGNEVSYNDISKVLKEADDMGAIYSGRSWVSRDNVIKFNYIHELTSDYVGTNDPSVGGIFLDDHFADMTIFGNIFEEIGGNAIKLNGGREHTIENNIFIDCDDYPVEGSEATGLDTSYNAKHIPEVLALLNYPAWTEHVDYAGELFNTEKTGYNSDLLCTRDIVIKNNIMYGWKNGVANLADANGDNGTVTQTNEVVDTLSKSAITAKISAFDFTDMLLDKAGIQ